MIRVYARRRRGRFCLYVQGHAQRGEEGSRVCAAVSALVGLLVRHAERSPHCTHVRGLLQSGSSSLCCCEDGGEIFDSVLDALSVLASENPTHMARVVYLRDDQEKEQST